MLTFIKVFIQSFDKSIHSSLDEFKELIITMSSAKSVTFLDGQDKAAQPPIGCGFSTLSDKCKLYIMLKGIIDIEKEEAKLVKKKVSAILNVYKSYCYSLRGVIDTAETAESGSTVLLTTLSLTLW